MKMFTQRAENRVTYKKINILLITKRNLFVSFDKILKNKVQRSAVTYKNKIENTIRIWKYDNINMNKIFTKDIKFFIFKSKLYSSSWIYIL